MQSRFRMSTELEVTQLLNNKQESKALGDVYSVLYSDIKKMANSQLANYSKITSVFEQTEPFIKTPTKKIKRYLHI